MIRILKGIYFLISAIVLFYIAYEVVGELSVLSNEVYLLGSILMLAISFPTGLLVSIIEVVRSFAEYEASTYTIWSWALEAWLPLFLLGYIQWFWLVPKASRALKKLWERNRTRVSGRKTK